MRRCQLASWLLLGCFLATVYLAASWLLLGCYSTPAATWLLLGSYLAAVGTVGVQTPIIGWEGESLVFEVGGNSLGGDDATQLMHAAFSQVLGREWRMSRLPVVSSRWEQ